MVGPASRASLREAGASGARMVVVRAGKSFPEQEASDADAEHIGHLVEVHGIACDNMPSVVASRYLHTPLRLRQRVSVVTLA